MNKFKTTLRKIFYIILILVIIFLIEYTISYSYTLYNAKKTNNLLNEISISEKKIVQKHTENIIIEAEKTKIEPKTERILKLEELQKENSDIIGWIEIENTNINYPVLQGNDNNFYLKRDYKKSFSKNGSIFLDKNYIWDPPSSNLLIYGHNNKNNTMFQDLLKYKNIEFYLNHPKIRFTTNKEDVNYEIMYIFESKVYYKSEQNVFRYYYFINAENEEQFNEYIQNCEKAKLYDTGKSAIYGDQLMTLSTCSYHVKDGRFVVVAKKADVSK